ncbi:MAG: helix-turn-helix domain-containing protein [Actinomycetota bacterium]|nr:helix-turn-helix domain-containing protein [Actinomycetota bacterium]
MEDSTQPTPRWGEYLTYAQAERYSGLSRSTLWRMLGRGEIRAVKAGSSVRIVRASLDEYLEAHAWRPPDDEAG